jgi:hypothetical protein
MVYSPAVASDSPVKQYPLSQERERRMSCQSCAKSYAIQYIFVFLEYHKRWASVPIEIIRLREWG